MGHIKPFLMGITIKRVHLSHSLNRVLFCIRIHKQICACKQDIQLMKIFCNTTISNFCKFETNLDVMKCVFHFAANRGFTMIYLFFPVDSII